jgi:hypothetical protein
MLGVLKAAQMLQLLADEVVNLAVDRELFTQCGFVSKGARICAI